MSIKSHLFGERFKQFEMEAEQQRQSQPIVDKSKIAIKNCDMKDDMKKFATDCAAEALEKFSIEKDVAAHIKRAFDVKFHPTWHCVVGRNFGSYVTHEVGHFIYFYLGQVAILLFKSG